MKNEHGEEWQIWQLTATDNEGIQIASMNDPDYAHDFLEMLNAKPPVHEAIYFQVLVQHPLECSENPC